MMTFGSKDFSISTDDLTLSGSLSPDSAYCATPLDWVLNIKVNLNADIFKKAKSSKKYEDDRMSCIIDCYSLALRMKLGLSPTQSWPFVSQTKDFSKRSSNGTKTLKFTHRISLPAHTLYSIGLDKLSRSSYISLDQICFSGEKTAKRLANLSELLKDYLSIKTKVFQRVDELAQEDSERDKNIYLLESATSRDKELLDDYLKHDISKIGIMPYIGKEDIFNIIENH
jgi:hypothetical protein